MNTSDHYHQELDIFSAYLDINEIPHDQSRKDLAHRILHQQHRQIISFHQRWFVFYYFDQYIKREILLEQFMTMGDIEWSCEDQINPHIYKEEHPCYLDSIKYEEIAKRDNSDLIVVDKTVWAYYRSQHPDSEVKGEVVVL